MPAITIWSKEKNDSTSLLSELELETGKYSFQFGSNILTRNTILQVAQMQREPVFISGKVITVIAATDDGKNINIVLDVKRGTLHPMQEAGFGKLSIMAALGVLGIIAIAFLTRVEKVLEVLPATLSKPGFIIIALIGLVLAWAYARAK